MSVMPHEFYKRDTVEVAKDLLGCKLVRKTEGKTLSGIIVETEAYTQDDPACHAYRGETPRAATLFKHPGIAYVYFIYGMYNCFNAVAHPEGKAGGILIRALETVYAVKKTNGPGKLCKALNITRELNEIDLTNPDFELYLERGESVPENQIITTTRIGIKNGCDYLWRFYIKDNPYVSRK